MNATLIAKTKKNYAKDLKIDGLINKFKKQLKNEHVERMSLRYFTGLGKINFPTKVDYRIKLHEITQNYLDLEKFELRGQLFQGQIQRLYLPKRPTFSTRFCSIKTLDNIYKQ